MTRSGCWHGKLLDKKRERASLGIYARILFESSRIYHRIKKLGCSLRLQGLNVNPGINSQNKTKSNWEDLGGALIHGHDEAC